MAPGGFPGLELLPSHRVLRLQQTEACRSGHQRLQTASLAPSSREEVLRELRLSSPGHQRAPGLGESQGAGWLPSAQTLREPVNIGPLVHRVADTPVGGHRWLPREVPWGFWASGSPSQLRPGATTVPQGSCGSCAALWTQRPGISHYSRRLVDPFGARVKGPSPSEATPVPSLPPWTQAPGLHVWTVAPGQAPGTKTQTSPPADPGTRPTCPRSPAAMYTSRISGGLTGDRVCLMKPVSEDWRRCLHPQICRRQRKSTKILISRKRQFL